MRITVTIAGGTVKPLGCPLTVLGTVQAQNTRLSDSWPAAAAGGVANSDLKHQDSAAQSTQGKNKGMDFLVALKLVEQFTLVKNIKCNKIRETAYPLYLVINK